MKKILLAICLTPLMFFLLPMTSNAQVYKDIATIMRANCNSCHHQGGIAFSMTWYGEVQPMGLAVKAAVESGHMPPWPPDPNYKHYVKERILSAADKNAIITWVNNGMPAGDTTQAPPVPVYGGTELNGTPDLILSLPVYTSTATNSDHYYCINVPTGLLQDRYIRAFEFIPGNPAIIHHAVMTIDTTGLAVNDMSGGCFNQQGQIGIGDYAPGMGPTVLPGVFPVKFGMRLKAGSQMSFQVHVPAGTAGQQDSSKLRIYFYPQGEPGIRDMFFNTVLQNWNFYVPAHDSLLVTQNYPAGPAGLPIAVSLYGSFPHSHKTCTSILNYAYQGNDTIPLIHIPHWDFHWQGQYTFRNMVKVPAGYKLFGAHMFDNTINNPETPDPNIPVLPGTNTTDEMFFDSFLFTWYAPGDELVNIDSILQNDPLFYPTFSEDFDKTLLGVNVYPNPFSGRTQLDYSLLSAQYVSIRIFHINGVEVRHLFSGIEGSGKHSHQWDGRGNSGDVLPAGVYTYMIQAGQKVIAGKMVMK